MSNLNRVVLTGNLTRDPELTNTQGGTSVCQLRIANNVRVKRGGEWSDKANYFDVVCFGALADNTNRYMEKGRAVAIDGRLDYQEWEKDGQKRQTVKIIADNIQFISDGRGDSDRQDSAPAATATSPAPDEEDIPF